MNEYHSLNRRRRRKRRFNWARFLLFLLILALVITAVVVGIHLISTITGKPSPTGTLNPQVTGTVPGQSATLPPTPTPTPVTKLPDNLTVTQTAENNPDKLGVKTDIMSAGQPVSSFSRVDKMSFAQGKDYTKLEGVITFGGSNYRDTFTYGTAVITQKKMEKAWEVPMGAIDGWSGTGWTGMPLLVKWPDATKQVMGMKDSAKATKDLVEVIYPTMDGKIYFLDLATGAATRDKINIGVPTKGTGSIDPRGYPLLYTGQGIDTVNGKAVPVYFRAISLITNKEIWKFGKKDPFSHRAWQAYDSSALVDAGSDTLVTGGENGVLYTVKLNTSYDEKAGTLSMTPEGLVKYRYTNSEYGDSDNARRWYGIENSITAWRNYAFFTDNGGLLQCVDLNTMELVYAIDVLDDSDTSLVLEEDLEKGTFYLYTANEVDKQPTKNGMGFSYHRKIDGPTGVILWEKKWDASVGNASSNGGTLTTPHVGKGNISNLVIYAMDLVPVTVTNSDGAASTVSGGRIVAYDKTTGNQVWVIEQKDDYWSSPVVVYTEDGTAYLVQGDRGGFLKLYDAKTKALLDTLDLGSRIDSTPAVYGNMLVVGTRGIGGSGEKQKIIGVLLK
ncbi:MAG: outer membrane protein assembly factor BamB family protein [Christensenellales bacterium]